MVQRPVETASPVHILPPRPLLMHLRSTLDRLFPYALVFGRSESAKAHHGRHGGVHAAFVI